mmetsp:Transcript_91920/g.259665  ORF Transcript_91920/g.259665 Transcript_91920/m.259665 type:complete len:309 (-) Transcript_91920:74-1000(-)
MVAPQAQSSLKENWVDCLDERESNQPNVEEGDVCEDVILNSASGLSPKGDVGSIGSRHHDAGRCKPCVFFHTKGCQNGTQCPFCHRCPPFEKQRRKRVCRQLTQKFHKGATDSLDRGFRQGGHSRQDSGVSTASSWSTRAGHSRQASSTGSTGAPSTWGEGEYHLASGCEWAPDSPLVQTDDAGAAARSTTSTSDTFAMPLASSWVERQHHERLMPIVGFVPTAVDERVLGTTAPSYSPESSVLLDGCGGACGSYGGHAMAVVPLPYVQMQATPARQHQAVNGAVMCSVYLMPTLPMAAPQQPPTWSG